MLENTGMNISYLIDTDKAGTGLMSNLFCDFYFVYRSKDSSGSENVFALAPFTASLEEKWHDNHSHTCSLGYETPSSLGYFMHTLGYKGSNDNYKLYTNAGGTVQTQFGNSGGGIPSGFSHPTLLFNVWEPALNVGGRGGLWIEQDLGATTILSLSNIINKASFQNGIRVAHMSDADYETARGLLWDTINLQSSYFPVLYDVKYLTGSNAGNIITPNVTSNLPNGMSDNGKTPKEFNLKSGTITDLMNVVSDYKAHTSDYNTTLSTTKGYVYSYVSGTLKTETRYAVCAYDSSASKWYVYMPFDYLIRPDAGEFITQIFNSLSSEGSPTNTNVSYDNWKKNDY